MEEPDTVMKSAYCDKNDNGPHTLAVLAIRFLSRFVAEPVTVPELILIRVRHDVYVIAALGAISKIL